MYNKKHLISLLGYLGIGFIGGAISHGFFSEQRSIIMATIGIILFIVSEILSGGQQNYFEVIIFGLVYSIAVGMVSGGFQHFLDSPTRSLWIIPVGFLISLVIYPLKYNESAVNWKKSLIVGLITSGALACGLFFAYQYLPAGVFSPLSDHHSQQESEQIENHTATQNSISEHEVHACLMGQTNQNCKEILDPQYSKQYGTYVLSVCQMMPMSICETYFGGTGYLQDSHAQGHDMNHADMVTSDFDFVTLMIPHHQEAVDTSIKLLQTTNNPQLIKLGNNIILAQQQEIKMMKSWVDTYYSGKIYTGMEYMPMMRDTSKMSDHLEIDSVWTQDMIKHHEGAVDMAKKLLSLLDAGTYQKQDNLATYYIELRNFAQEIIKLQTEEISQMKTILGEADHDH